MCWINWFRIKVFMQPILFRTEISILVCKKKWPNISSQELQFPLKSPQITKKKKKKESSNIISVANVDFSFMWISMVFFVFCFFFKSVSYWKIDRYRSKKDFENGEKQTNKHENALLRINTIIKGKNKLTSKLTFLEWQNNNNNNNRRLEEETKWRIRKNQSKVLRREWISTFGYQRSEQKIRYGEKVEANRKEPKRIKEQRTNKCERKKPWEGISRWWKDSKISGKEVFAFYWASHVYHFCCSWCWSQNCDHHHHMFSASFACRGSFVDLALW